MIRVNLMPRAEARRQAARQRDKQIAVVVAVALALVLLIAELVSRTESNRVQSEADERQTELAELNKKHNEATLLEKRRAQLRAKLATIDILERQRRGPIHVLDDLSTATPQKLWLTEMRESGGGVTLIGRGLDNQTIAHFMRKLGASPFFESVDLVEAKQVEEGQAKLKQFTISARVNYAGRAVATSGKDKSGDGNGEEPSSEDRAKPGAAGPSAADGGPLGSAVAARSAAQRAAGATEGRQNDEAVEAAALGAVGALR